MCTISLQKQLICHLTYKNLAHYYKSSTPPNLLHLAFLTAYFSFPTLCCSLFTPDLFTLHTLHLSSLHLRRSHIGSLLFTSLFSLIYTTHSSLLFFHCLLLTYSSLFTLICQLLTAHSSFPTFHSSLLNFSVFTAHSSLLSYRSYHRSVIRC